MSETQADAFRHYLIAMTKFFDSLALRLPSGAPALLVVGHSKWNHSERFPHLAFSRR